MEKFVANRGAVRIWQSLIWSLESQKMSLIFWEPHNLHHCIDGHLEQFKDCTHDCCTASNYLTQTFNHDIYLAHSLNIKIGYTQGSLKRFQGMAQTGTTYNGTFSHYFNSFSLKLHIRRDSLSCCNGGEKVHISGLNAL